MVWQVSSTSTLCGCSEMAMYPRAAAASQVAKKARPTARVVRCELTDAGRSRYVRSSSCSTARASTAACSGYQRTCAMEYHAVVRVHDSHDHPSSARPHMHVGGIADGQGGHLSPWGGCHEHCAPRGRSCTSRTHVAVFIPHPGRGGHDRCGACAFGRVWTYLSGPTARDQAGASS